MRDIGRITLWNTEFIAVEENDGLYLIPKENEALRKVKEHIRDRDFVVCYHGERGLDSIAFVEQVEFSFTGHIKLLPKYIINHCISDSFTSLEITGDVIDDFFSPAHYFFDRSKDGDKNTVDLVYNCEVADKWEIQFAEKPLTITLSFGDILEWGSASDLKLHPKLTIEFAEAVDVQYVYRVYSFVLRFLRVVRYDSKCGKIRVDLYSHVDGKLSLSGSFRDFSIDQESFDKGNHYVQYGYYKTYIQRFLQFSADNPNYTFYHYPTEGLRYLGCHYSAVDFINIFSAFEAECRAQKNLYEKVDTSKVQSIKDILVEQIEAISEEGLDKVEVEFLENAKKRIMQLGTQVGQSKKIETAYQVLQNALDGSIENIFYLPEFRLKGSLTLEQQKKISGFLTGQRAKVAHGGFSGGFSDIDAQKIHFLEVMTYAQLLKRIGLDDVDIERIIGAVFACNYRLAEEIRGRFRDAKS